MYLLIFIPKNLVVTYCPFSPYQRTLVVVGSPFNEPRACLSVPTATTMFPLPARMAFAACWIVAAPVAHALNTLMNGMPLRPTRPVRGSVETPQLPPKAHWTSFHVRLRRSTPARRRRRPVECGLVAVSSEGVQADTDDGDIVHSALLTVLRANGREGEGDDLVAIVVDIERHDSEHDVHAEVELLGSHSVSRDSTRTTSSSCTNPIPKGSKDLPVGSPRSRRWREIAESSRTRGCHDGVGEARPCSPYRSVGTATARGR